MADKCGRDYSDHTLLVTPHCSQNTGLCDATNASAAAFMLLRGPHAFWGGGFWWGVNVVEQPSLWDERMGYQYAAAFAPPYSLPRHTRPPLSSLGSYSDPC